MPKSPFFLSSNMITLKLYGIKHFIRAQEMKKASHPIAIINSPINPAISHLFLCGSSTFFRRRAFLFLGWLSLVKRAARAKESKVCLAVWTTTTATSFIYARILFSGGGRGQDIDASSLHDVSSSWQNLQRIELCWSIIARKEEEEEEEEGG
jgi:hypothetical protein